jgi:hypothetical protein
VGFNPLRRYRGSKAADIAILVSMMAVLAALIIWASR